jgi:hypothetical protein
LQLTVIVPHASGTGVWKLRDSVGLLLSAKVTPCKRKGA